MNQNREYRMMEMRIQKNEDSEEPTYKVEGYASTFEPYVLFSEGETEYKEQIDPNAFDDADLSDVVFRVDHEGKVYARISSGDLEVWTDEHGLANRTDLSRTASGRALFEEIEAGHYPQMSFAFTVAEGGDKYDKKTHTRTINRIAKVFDVSPVAFPANPTTALGVATRDYFNGVIEMEKAERLEREKRERKKLTIKLLLEEF